MGRNSLVKWFIKQINGIKQSSKLSKIQEMEKMKIIKSMLYNLKGLKFSY